MSAPTPPALAPAPVPAPASPDSVQPPTPLSPTGSDASRPNTASDSGPAPKRKASRRANTAERRATHNAVERQRRETLNGRFLDLAALLPNLATVRRPSKSAIVNSSIALIHSQRRARAAAGRELRGVEAEADALRREVNEWRARSGAALPALLAPQRSPEFLAIAGAEDAGAAAEEEERRAYALAGAGMEDDEDLDPPDDLPAARGMPAAAPAPGPDPDKLAQWNVQLQFALAQQQAQQRQQEWVHHAQAAQQAALFTPPSSAHSDPDVFAGFTRTQTFPAPFAYGFPASTPDMDDSGTESTHGSPASERLPHHHAHSHSHSHSHSAHHAAAQLQHGFGFPVQARRPSLGMPAHSTGHVPQQWGGAVGVQFPPVSLLI